MRRCFTSFVPEGLRHAVGYSPFSRGHCAFRACAPAFRLFAAGDTAFRSVSYHHIVLHIGGGLTRSSLVTPGIVSPHVHQIVGGNA